jgi:hypothetical protein
MGSGKVHGKHFIPCAGTGDIFFPRENMYQFKSRTVYIYISAGLLVCTTVWLGIGGLRDLASLFRDLRSADRDYSDTGEVKHDKSI